jgi:hypothetical protein
MLPNFLIIGTAKSGTTTLARQLCKHPSIGFASAAEPNFFAFDENYSRGMAYYESFFSHCTRKMLVGEKSWRYSVGALYPKARDRIAEHLPNARLVYIVRHPLARAESLWMECLSSGADVVSTDFNKAIKENILFVESSKYWTQLNRYRDYFSDSRILVLFHENLSTRHRSVLDSLFSFVGIECALDSSFKELWENVSEGKSGDNALLAAARRIPGFNSFRNAAPQIARSGLRRVLKRKLDRPTWDDDTRKWFLDQVYEDCRHILSYAGRDSDYWIY